MHCETIGLLAASIGKVGTSFSVELVFLGSQSRKIDIFQHVGRDIHCAASGQPCPGQDADIRCAAQASGQSAWLGQVGMALGLFG